jgi:DNA-binding MarR family transcriptional regulator
MQPLPITTVNGQGADECALEVLDTVPPVVWFIRREMRMFRKGLSLQQFRTLSLIYRQPSACLSVVAEHAGASLPTASRLVQGLVDKGLVVRRESQEDRRQLVLAISPSGQAILHSVWAGTQERLAEQVGRLSPEERQSVADAMQALKKVFGALGLSEALNRV